MPHDFSIDKKTGIILIAACGLVGVLLLVAGFLLGIQYRFSSSTTKPKSQSSSAQVKHAHLKLPAAKPVPQSPRASVAQGNSAPLLVSSTPLSRQSSGNTNMDKTAKNNSPEKSHNSPEAAVQSPRTHSAAVSQESPTSPTAQVAQHAGHVAATPSPSQPTNIEKYSIQIGAFLNPKNAKHLMKELKEKGYKARIFVATGAKYRVWHTVRIGLYKNIEIASQAARRFRRTEHLLAIVRPADSL